MSDKNYILPIGLKYDGRDFRQLEQAETSGEAEKIYTKKPSQTKLYTWFGQMIAASVERIGDEIISENFLKAGNDRNVIPDPVAKIPLVDSGSLLIQIQRDNWEDVIEGQKIRCVGCGQVFKADIDLKRIPVPEMEGPVVEFYDVALDRAYEINTKVEQLAVYDGQKFNGLRFRVPLLEDAIKREGVAKDEVEFWRLLAFDCVDGLYYRETPESEPIMVTEGYIGKRGQKLFKDDLTTKTLKKIRTGLQTGLPSVKYFYDEECPECGVMTPFFASVSNFFST